MLVDEIKRKPRNFEAYLCGSLYSTFKTSFYPYGFCNKRLQMFLDQLVRSKAEVHSNILNNSRSRSCSRQFGFGINDCIGTYLAFHTRTHTPTPMRDFYFTCQINVPKWSPKFFSRRETCTLFYASQYGCINSPVLTCIK